MELMLPFSPPAVLQGDLFPVIIGPGEPAVLIEELENTYVLHSCVLTDNGGTGLTDGQGNLPL